MNIEPYNMKNITNRLMQSGKFSITWKVVKAPKPVQDSFLLRGVFFYIILKLDSCCPLLKSIIFVVVCASIKITDCLDQNLLSRIVSIIKIG